MFYAFLLCFILCPITYSLTFSEGSINFTEIAQHIERNKEREIFGKDLHGMMNSFFVFVNGIRFGDLLELDGFWHGKKKIEIVLD